MSTTPTARGGSPRGGVVVLGAARSGTSLLAGLLVDAGFDPGDGLIPPSEHNPTGFFERLEVNRINDDVLAPAVAARSVPGALVPPRAQWWLAALDGPVREGPVAVDVLRAAIPERPFVVKDPRLSYTLPAWEPVLGTAEVLCVVRDPGEVVASILAMARREPGDFAAFEPTVDHLVAMWEAVYASVEELAGERAVTWVHFDDLLHGDGVGRLTEVLAVELAGSRRTPGLHRSRAVDVPDRIRRRHGALRAHCS